MISPKTDASPRPAGKRKLLGERLIESGLITPDQLDLALREQNRTKERIGEILINLGFVTQELISSVLASEAGVTFIQLDNYLIEPSALKAVPEAMARQHKIIPILLEPPRLTIAMANVFDVLAIDEVQRVSGYIVDVASATESSVLASIDRDYAGGASLEEIIQKSVRQVEAGRISEADLASGAPIVRLVEQIFITAVQGRGTDIHFEPEERIFRIRYRIDGKLRPGPSLPKALQPAVTARVKIISGMNIAETRLPQDGKINFHVGKRKVDLRVSTLPTVFGENMVLRVLDRARLVVGLESLGFDEQTLAKFRRAIESRHGILLVCGPTGSGKTTTLYSALSYINAIDRSIITLEDPVEYELPIIRQCQINVKAGLTFAAGLRSILRHDPDVILVGEMRDAETVELAIRSSLTGHLVFSTLHTNDAAGAIPASSTWDRSRSSSPRRSARSSARRSCGRTARTARLLHPRRRRSSGRAFPGRAGTFFKEGCGQCGDRLSRPCRRLRDHGSHTRDHEARDGAANSQDLLAAAQAEGMTTMLQDAVAKALKGLTTLEEALKVT
jgi:type IV pilus assembly protein PilB